ncbi:MAG: hypothetical protein EXX96DRAFT_608857 [Benjaminiella poitrasii]|nr:MAG: hypothetical protein EXX96DRAFT_608857 [Benjaminiella poitrasii]
MSRSTEFLVLLNAIQRLEQLFTEYTEIGMKRITDLDAKIDQLQESRSSVQITLRNHLHNNGLERSADDEKEEIWIERDTMLGKRIPRADNVRINKDCISKEMATLLRQREVYREISEEDIQEEVEYQYNNTVLLIKVYFIFCKKINTNFQKYCPYAEERKKELIYFETFLSLFYYKGIPKENIWPKNTSTGVGAFFPNPSVDSNDFLTNDFSNTASGQKRTYEEISDSEDDQ